MEQVEYPIGEYHFAAFFPPLGALRFRFIQAEHPLL
jgi:hypothetical protein